MKLHKEKNKKRNTKSLVIQHQNFTAVASYIIYLWVRRKALTTF
jgi:hypothetical protein